MIIAMMATGLYLILATVWRRRAKQKMEHLRNGTQHSLAQAGLMIFGMNAQGKYFIKRGASSRWSFGPNSACGSKETVKIEKTHSTLIFGPASV